MKAEQPFHEVATSRSSEPEINSLSNTDEQTIHHHSFEIQNPPTSYAYLGGTYTPRK